MCTALQPWRHVRCLWTDTATLVSQHISTPARCRAALGTVSCLLVTQAFACWLAHSQTACVLDILPGHSCQPECIEPCCECLQTTATERILYYTCAACTHAPVDESPPCRACCMTCLPCHPRVEPVHGYGLCSQAGTAHRYCSCLHCTYARAVTFDAASDAHSVRLCQRQALAVW